MFPLTRLAFDLGVEDVNVLGADLWKEGNWIVYLNGLVRPLFVTLRLRL